MSQKYGYKKRGVCNTLLSIYVDKALVEEFQKRGCIKGIIPEGGFMGPIELLKEEGRQEGRQEEQRELILKMLKEELDISLVSKVTGLPEKEIRKLKDRS